MEGLFWLGGIAFLLGMMGWIGWRWFYPAPGVRPRRVEPVPRNRTAWFESWSLRLADLAHGLRTWRRFRLGRVERRMALILPAVITLPILLALFLRSRFELDPLKAERMEREQHIRTSLNPERLLPPPPLPPALFISADRPDLQTADRDWGRLQGAFQQELLRTLARLRRRGFEFVLIEGYRSADRQDMLARMGPAVTRAKGGQSRHQYGLAADLAPLKDGRLQLSEKDPWSKSAYMALGEEAETSGLRWGGRWILRDFGHVETQGSISSYAGDSRKKQLTHPG